MPTDWADDILLADLADEPEMSEEFGAIFDRLKVPAGADAPEGAGPAADVSYRRPAASSVVGVPHVVLNFASVSRLNSSHLAALLRIRKRIAESGKTLVLCGMGADLQTLMRHTGLDRIFRFAPDTMTALAQIQMEAEGD